ncbi:MAG: cation-translocating P-type ATPase [Oscillospiraceae bacterium]|jgi:Ca2+-transporting ATPase|nr:cation-translocating P-type ATPase [Oscillospiraceae bacterium]
MRYYLSAIADVFEHVKSDLSGLTQQEAEERLARDGKNKLNQAKKDSIIKRFLKQLVDPMIIVLLVAAFISGVLAVVEGEGLADVIIILVVVLINAVLGVYQENKAEAAIEALQEMSAATSKVLREGEVQSIKSENLAVGDVILLEAGDAVPADARVFECASLKIEEAALTGESVPVTKLLDQLNPGENGDVTLGDRKNMVYMGSSVAYGRGKAVVTATGMQTQMGLIADAIAKAEDGQTPLQIKLTQLSKILTWLVLGICAFMFAFHAVRNFVTEGGFGTFSDILSIFMVAVALAVAAIPEGLAAVVTIVLSIGVTNMSKKKAIIRRLTAVETLGCAQIICSDKTGTLTQNKMTVVDHYAADEHALAIAMALCSDAERTAVGETIGEPTEIALVNYAASLSLEKNDLKKQYPRVCEAPFDSVRKMMSTVHRTEDGFVQFTKGAPDEILQRCTHVGTPQGAVPISADDKEQILAQNKRMANKALRVLAAATKQYTMQPDCFDPERLESDLVFIGLTGMIDPVRPEVKDAIAECRNAGIRAIMITGDHKDTAAAIASELGILDGTVKAITGAELSAIGDAEFDETVGDYAVYARVQPEHKVRIVNAWRKRGMVTAMTGDGVNDAPAIKGADIGVGMGITGTDVTKNVADMVLADDNFATIVAAVGEGRRIYTNIRKAIQFLLGSNLSEVLTVFVSTLLGLTILKPVHLLWINLVTDCLPALALGMEKPEHNIMSQKPRRATEGVFSGGVGFDVIYQGFLVSALTMAAFYIGEFFQANTSLGLTMAFLTMSMCEIFHSFNMRSQRGSVITMTIRSGHNLWLWGSMLVSLLLTTLVVMIPFFQDAFGFAAIGAKEYCIAIALAFSVIPIVEIVKLLQRAVTKRKNRE